APLTRPAPLCTMPRRHPSTDRASAVFCCRGPLTARHHTQRRHLRPVTPDFWQCCRRPRTGIACGLAHRACPPAYARSVGGEAARKSRDHSARACPSAPCRSARACPSAHVEDEEVMVDLYEYQGRELFARHGLPVLGGGVAETPDQARAIAEQQGGRVVVKAQGQVRVRGNAGGVKLADTVDEAQAHATNILG